MDAITAEGKSALMHAVARNGGAATAALLEGGADLGAVDREGCSALHHGARTNAADCL